MAGGSGTVFNSVCSSCNVVKLLLASVSLPEISFNPFSASIILPSAHCTPTAASANLPWANSINILPMFCALATISKPLSPRSNGTRVLIAAKRFSWLVTPCSANTKSLPKAVVVSLFSSREIYVCAVFLWLTRRPRSRAVDWANCR